MSKLSNCLCAAALLLLAGVSCRQPSAKGRYYVASIAPVGLILQEICGQRAAVKVLLPPGASPHTFDPTPAQAQEAAAARAVFFVSAGLDGWAADLGGGTAVCLLETCLPADFQLESQDHDEPGADPHFWTDPETVLAALPGITEELERADPAGSAEYEANRAAFAAELRATLPRIRDILSGARGRPALLMHPSFLYLFKRYGIGYAGSVEEFAGKEPSPKELAQLRDRVTAQGVKVLFIEPGLPRGPVQGLAEDCGLTLVEIYPEACPDGTSSYLGWLTANAEIIAGALGDPPAAL